MYRGWLVYNQEDLKKNQAFAELLIKHGQACGLVITLLVREDICMGIEKGKLYIETSNKRVLPDFVINRTRDVFFAEHLTYLGIKVFNSEVVTRIANDKIKSHQLVSGLGIESVDTFFYDGMYQTPQQIPIPYPLILKTVDGHGGTEVYYIVDEQALIDRMKQLERRYYVVQACCSQVGVDVRVFVVGNRPIAAIKRVSHVDFRSNYSLGGKVALVPVDDALEKAIAKIVDTLPCDCVGIDFMIDQAGQYLFNEIEDVVGCRSLYQQSTIDLAWCYCEHIQRLMHGKRRD